MGELSFFLGLQVRQLEGGSLFNKAKYTKELLKKFGMRSCYAALTSMSSSLKLDKDEDGQSVDSTAYRGIIVSLLYLTSSMSDILLVVGVYYVGCKVDMKNTSGTCQFFGDRLVSGYSKKQTSIATTMTEAEYLAAGSCCAQLLWIQQ
ncbi:uncharacterized mitochondrial protein AtMg00810-like [Impatiens glandulifera]|uniref:uncharacterized mitochondrial protein AtMg00810-like n=1 Tax=Impatiens glandulifera TaxID=253017 RepID=UPI001FB198C5|nr:uncharacterized mitochondrial protein AtMg00810-like [Impatiens glandulifera]